MSRVAKVGCTNNFGFEAACIALSIARNEGHCVEMISHYTDHSSGIC